MNDKMIKDKEEAVEILAKNLTGIQWNLFIFLLGEDDPFLTGK